MPCFASRVRSCASWVLGRPPAKGAGSLAAQTTQESEERATTDAIAREPFARRVHRVEARPRSAVVVRRATRHLILRRHRVSDEESHRRRGTHAEQELSCRQDRERRRRRRTVLVRAVDVRVIDVVEPAAPLARSPVLGLTRHARTRGLFDDLVDGGALDAQLLLQRLPVLHSILGNTARDGLDRELHPLVPGLECLVGDPQSKLIAIFTCDGMVCRR